MRMMDLIRAGGLEVPHGLRVPPAWTQLLGEAPVFTADSAVAWYYGAEQEYWLIHRDFPVLAPPYPAFFVEAKAPPSMWCEALGHEAWPADWPRALGWLVSAYRVSDEDRERGVVELFWRRELNGTLPVGEGIGDAVGDVAWLMRADLLLELADPAPRVIGPMVRWCWELGEDGSMLHDASPAPRLCSKNLAGIDVKLFEALGRVWLDPLLATLTFLHCRNVETRLVEAPTRLNRARQRRGKQPLVSYRVLDIEPLRRPAPRRGNGSGGGGDPAATLRLHCRRGGFRTYGKDAPLFGKWTGTWFWSEQMWVGNEHQGRVEKDYRVRADRRAG